LLHHSFNQADVRPFAESILMACFTQIQRGDTPQKIAENDHLMKCELNGKARAMIATAKR
jgi:exportin-2 (importin alpha re-exporter)